MNDSVTEALPRDEAALGFDPRSLSPARGLARLLRERVHAQARALRDCQLRMIDADGDMVLGTPAADPSQTLHATMWVRDPAFYRQLALAGSVGGGEA
jgi:cyclopropane-fatty-acyl-phospholipid synthase